MIAHSTADHAKYNLHINTRLSAKKSYIKMKGKRKYEYHIKIFFLFMSNTENTKNTILCLTPNFS